MSARRVAVLALGCATAACGGGSAAGPGARAAAAGPRADCADVARELSMVSERAHLWAGMKEGGTVRIVYEYHRMTTSISAGAVRLGALEVGDPSLRAAVDASRGSLGRLARSVATFQTTIDAFLREAGARWVRGQTGLAAILAGCTKSKSDCQALAAARDNAGELFTVAEVDAVRDATAKIQSKSPEVGKARDGTVKELEALGQTIGKFDKADAVNPADLTDFGKKFGDLRTRCESTLPRAALGAGEQWVTGAGTEPRRVTAVVRVPLQGKLREQFLSFAEAESDPQRAALFRAVSDGGFGSGVVVVHDMGGERKSYVVTNEHVVKSAVTAQVLFDGGAPIAADVVHVDAEHDLAVLALRKEMAAGVGLSVTPPRDQDLVFAAGFPGFGATPSYQITRGYISNERLALGPGMTHLQHTAPIDPGSSGGPLLSGTKLLVGLNTKKGVGRENVGIAVPAVYVVESVRDARHAPKTLGTAAGRRQDARMACLEFLNGLVGGGGGLPLLEHRISVGLLEARGLESYNLLLPSVPQLEVVLKNDPLQAFRLAVAGRIAADLRASRLSPYEACLSPNEGDFRDVMSTDRVRFSLATREGPRTLTLKMEQGTYKLSAFDFTDKAPPGSPATPAERRPR